MNPEEDDGTDVETKSKIRARWAWLLLIYAD